MKFIGIDPGRTGALAVVDENGKVVSIFRARKSVHEKLALMRELSDIPDGAAVEEFNPSPKFPGHTVKLMERDRSQWVGILASHGVRIIEPSPQSWQKLLPDGKPQRPDLPPEPKKPKRGATREEKEAYEQVSKQARKIRDPALAKHRKAVKAFVLDACLKSHPELGPMLDGYNDEDRKGVVDAVYLADYARIAWSKQGGK